MRIRKLELHRETVRNLTNNELQDVAGGRPPHPVLIKISYQTFCISGCTNCPDSYPPCFTYGDTTCG